MVLETVGERQEDTFEMGSIWAVPYHLSPVSVMTVHFHTKS